MDIIFGVQKPPIDQSNIVHSVISADFVSDLIKFVPNIFQNFVQVEFKNIVYYTQLVNGY